MWQVRKLFEKNKEGERKKKRIACHLSAAVAQIPYIS
jgi:hypothetical protein